MERVSAGKAASTPPDSTEAHLCRYGNLSDGTQIDLCVLRASFLEATICSFGARVIDLRMRGDDGAWTSVVLGYPSLADYLGDTDYMGAIVGRFANRIAKGRFTVLSRQYQVSQNDGENSLHGGRRGFDQRVWEMQVSGDRVILKYSSQDGEEGYPGTLETSVQYRIHGRALHIAYEAQATAETPLNLSSHMYFNLGGQSHEAILDHVVSIAADAFTPIDAALIPTGKIEDVRGTPLDFRETHSIGERIGEDHSQLRFAQGYDHNWVLSKGVGEFGLAARVYEPRSRRQLTVSTTEPGLQFYSGNQLRGVAGQSHPKHGFRCGFCLETQHFPDSPNHPHFPTTLLKPGEKYRSHTSYHLGSYTSI